MGNLTKNFGTDTDPNFKCPCCGQCQMHPAFMHKLQKLRTALGVPFTVVRGGGYRCDTYDTTYSAHKEGKAADLDLHFSQYFMAIILAYQVGMTGIGVRNSGSGKNKRYQLHLDNGDNITDKRPRPWFWTY